MKVAKKDWLFIAVIAAVLGALFLGTGKEKARNIPDDEKHSPFYESMHTSGARTETEKICTTCHGPRTIPLPAAHPPKEQCLLCHKLVRS
jgi:hypothetical protein